MFRPRELNGLTVSPASLRPRKDDFGVTFSGELTEALKGCTAEAGVRTGTVRPEATDAPEESLETPLEFVRHGLGMRELKPRCVGGEEGGPAGSDGSLEPGRGRREVR